MTRHRSNTRPGSRASFTLAVIAGLGLTILASSPARGAEIIPSVGFTRPVDGDETTVLSGGVALRSQLMPPFLLDEIAVSYRSESRFDDQLKVRMWPVTASLWLAPVPALYAGGGVGFYNVTLDYDEDTLGQLFEDKTSQEFGVHVGGGVRVPLAPKAALDLGGRYVMMRALDDRLVPNHFDPDFWSANIGLAIGF